MNSFSEDIGSHMPTECLPCGIILPVGGLSLELSLWQLNLNPYHNNLGNGLAISFVWHRFCQLGFLHVCVWVCVCICSHGRHPAFLFMIVHLMWFFFCSAFPCVGNFYAWLFPLPLSAIWSKCFLTCWIKTEGGFRHLFFLLLVKQACGKAFLNYYSYYY